MELNRKPFQGTWNIIRFNWHFYVISFTACLTALLATVLLDEKWHYLCYLAIVFVLLPLAISLLVSYYIYDFSNLYQLNWLNQALLGNKGAILNINAGFDETSGIIQNKFTEAKIHICDFYDPNTHTEVSIKRARNAYPPHPDTIKVSTDRLPYPNSYFDMVCAVFVAHEVREEAERVGLFEELRRVLKPEGKLYVTEHLRDGYNFGAYNIGFLHFFSRNTWLNTFNQSGLVLLEEEKITPFVRTFILTTHGNTP